MISTVGQQQAITQEVDNAYQSKKNDIDDQYAAAFRGLYVAPAPAGGSMPPLPVPPADLMQPPHDHSQRQSLD